MTDLRQDLWYGIRALRREPAFVASIVLSLALGIGIHSAALSFLDTLFKKPLPGIRDADRVLCLYTRIRKNHIYLPLAYLNFRDLRQGNRSFSQLTASHFARMALAGRGVSEPIDGELVTSNYFSTLGIEPLLGRFFSSTEDRELEADHVVVLSEALWKRRFAGDASVIGRSILLNQRSFVVLGVAGGRFRGTRLLVPTDVWLPLGTYRELSASPELFERRSDQVVQVMGRLAPGVPARRAGAEIASIAASLAKVYPAENRDQTIASFPLSEARISPNSRSNLLADGALLLVITGILLLVTCSNVASLLLVRALRRSGEYGLRSALGASRWRLLRQMLAEALSLTALALPAAVIVAEVSARLLWQLRPPALAGLVLGRPLELRLLGFQLAVATISIVLSELSPAAHVLRLRPASALNESAVRAPGRRTSFFQQWFVGAEIALGFVAVSCAIFFMGRLRQLEAIDPGFDSASLLALSFDLSGLAIAPPAIQPFEERVRAEIARLPGVQSMAFAENRLLDGSHMLRSAAPAERGEDPILAHSGSVDPEYFRTTGISILAGRSFQNTDRSGTPPVAIVSQTMAAKLRPSGSPVGQYLFLDEEKTPVQIVGVARDVKLTRLDEPPSPFLYLALQQRPSSRLTLHVRTAGDPAVLLKAAEHQVRSLEGAIPLEGQTITETIERSLRWTKASVSLLMLLSFVALLVAGIGIYGAMEYKMSHRRFEIGLRIALGAGRRSIACLMLKDCARIVLAGVGLGALLALGLLRWSAGLLASQPTLPGLIACCSLVSTVALCGALWPLRRAMRVPPAEILKDSFALRGAERPKNLKRKEV